MKLIVSTCLVVMAAFAFAQEHCAGGDCAKEKSKAGHNKVMTEDQKFLALAKQMAMEAEGKKACCKSTAEKPMAKGDKGCCNEKGGLAKFKVFVAGQGYQFYGCEGSAAEGRAEWKSKGKVVGAVQKVTSKVAM